MTAGVSDPNSLPMPVPAQGTPKGGAKGRSGQRHAFEMLLDSEEAASGPPARKPHFDNGRQPDHTTRPREGIPPARGSETGQTARSNCERTPEKSGISADGHACPCEAEHGDEAAITPPVEENLIAALAAEFQAPAQGETIESAGEQDACEIDGQNTIAIETDALAVELRMAIPVHPPAAAIETKAAPLETMAEAVEPQAVAGTSLQSESANPASAPHRAQNGATIPALTTEAAAPIQEPAGQTPPLAAPDAFASDEQGITQEATATTKDAAPTPAKPLNVAQETALAAASPLAGKLDSPDAEHPHGQPAIATESKAAISARPDAAPANRHATQEPQIPDAPPTAQNAQQPAPPHQPSVAPPPGLSIASPPAPIALHPLIHAQAANAPLPGTLVPLAGVPIEIAARALEGHQRFEIRLDPPELGRIDVRLDVDRSGAVTTRLVVERAETLDLLRRDAPALEKALQTAGLKTDEGALEFSLRDHGFAQRQHELPRNARADAAQLILQDEDLASADAAKRGYGRLIGLGNGVDIRI